MPLAEKETLRDEASLPSELLMKERRSRVTSGVSTAEAMAWRQSPPTRSGYIWGLAGLIPANEVVDQVVAYFSNIPTQTVVQAMAPMPDGERFCPTSRDGCRPLAGSRVAYVSAGGLEALQERRIHFPRCSTRIEDVKSS